MASTTGGTLPGQTDPLLRGNTSQSGRRLNRSAAALGALAAGILAGAAIRTAGNDALAGLADMVRPVGTLWLNALKMTLVPLVFAMVAKGIVALDRGHGGGRLIGIAVPLMIGLLAAAMLTGMAIGLAFEWAWPAAQVTLGAASTTAIPETPTIGRMLVDLLPVNPVAAASNGAMASLVVFAILFGFAVSRSSDRAGDAVTPLLDHVAGAMLRIVEWVLRFTPIGIFALALGLAIDNGFGIAGFVARIALVSGVCAAVAILLGYGIAWIGGGIRPIDFGRAIASAQAMAAGTCSSAATLPAMIETSEQRLGIPSAIGGSVLPLAASIFRFAVLLYAGGVVILLTRAMGLPLDAPTLLLGGAVFILSNLGSSGVPGAAVMYAGWAAGLQVLGLPLELVPLLIAANVLPDILVTTGNVTADLAVTAVVARRLRSGRSPHVEETA